MKLIFKPTGSNMSLRGKEDSFDVIFNNEKIGEIHFNMRGYIGSVKNKNEPNVGYQFGEYALSRVKKEIKNVVSKWVERKEKNMKLEKIIIPEGKEIDCGDVIVEAGDTIYIELKEALSIIDWKEIEKDIELYYNKEGFDIVLDISEYDNPKIGDIFFSGISGYAGKIIEVDNNKGEFYVNFHKDNE